jgi:alpha-L-rhamnosidase
VVGPLSSLVCSDEQVNLLLKSAGSSEMAWWYEHLAGIRLEEVASRSFVIAPEPLKGLGWMKAEYDSPYGIIRSLWVRDGEMFCLEVEVPVNTIATVCLPVEHGTAGLISDVAPTMPVDNLMTFKVGSGTYTFAVPIR